MLIALSGLFKKTLFLSYSTPRYRILCVVRALTRILSHQVNRCSSGTTLRLVGTSAGSSNLFSPALRSWIRRQIHRSSNLLSLLSLRQVLSNNGFSTPHNFHLRMSWSRIRSKSLASKVLYYQRATVRKHVRSQVLSQVPEDRATGAKS